MDGIAVPEKAKEKTKAKQRYLKRKKQRRKNKPKASTAQVEPASDDGENETVSGAHSDGDEEIAVVDEAPLPEAGLRKETTRKEKRPKKRVKLAEDVEMQDTEPQDVIMKNSISTAPLPSLPSFPLPALPDAPSKTVLAVQGLDRALFGAEIVNSTSLLPIPIEDQDDGGTGLTERTRKRLSELGIVELFAVQTSLLPFLLPKNPLLRSLYLPFETLRDVCVSAPTGSGKTLAYVLPIVEILSTRIVTRLRALVVLPTRDLVTQVRETFEAVGKGRGLKIGTATGQHSFSHEQSQLVADKTTHLAGGSSKIDILICTPGRLIDHLNGTPNFSLQHLRFLVIDEADRLLAQSFQEWLAQVLNATRSPSQDLLFPARLPQHHDAVAPNFRNLLPYSQTRSFVTERKESSCQKLLFSATLTRDPGKLAALELRDPKYFVVQEKSDGSAVLDVAMDKFTMPANLTEHMLVCESSLKPLIFFHLVYQHNVTNALVFTKSAESTARLVRLFNFFDAAKRMGTVGDPTAVAVHAYSSDLTVGERKAILDKFKAKEIQILVCSDLISRGIDISHVSHVVSYDAPVDMRKYVHRVGRTARAGRSGDAWTLVEEQEARYFKAMVKQVDHLEKLKRMKVGDKDLAPLAVHYEGALNQLKESYTRVPFTSNKPPPPPGGTLEDAAFSPELTASFLDILYFGWITPLLGLGYKRPLEATDLYKLGDERSSAYIAERISASFDRRHKAATEYNTRLANGEINPGVWQAAWWSLRGNRAEREKKWREVTGKRRASLVWAMNDSIKWYFWSGGVLKIIGDTAQITSPLVVKAIIKFATTSYVAHQTGEKPPGIGRGIGLAICLLLMQLIGSLGQHHFFYRAMATGVLIRGGLITAIYSRSLRLTSRARSTLTNGKLVNHISSDVSRIDFCAGFFHMSWTAPIQMAICLALLIINLGPSALAGFAFFVLATPAQTYVMKQLFKYRQKSMVFTDKRAKTLQELLGGMKILKLFNWQIPYLARISGYRQKEMAYIRSLLLLRSGTNAVATSMPALASVLAFVTYSLTGHSLEASVIFASLTLFNLLRLPLMFLPVSFSAIADALTASHRLYDVFVAETFEDTMIRDDTLDVAVEVKDASFTWDGPPPELADGKKKKGKKPTALEKAAKAAAALEKAQVEQEKVFKMTNLNFSIPRGKLVAIVGAVGSGKTSLLQGMIGEMRRTSGYTKFGGSVGYCPQSAWIQNATIRENICFGLPFEEEKYWKAVNDSCLQPDLDMLPNGDMTEVGEKGISLSGGQRQRLNICRSIYSDTDIQIFDDPLSALDAHVGKAVFHNVLQNTLQSKTRILVTHALHFLPYVDYVITIADGRIAERGTYSELINNNGEFSRFIAEFGTKDQSEEPQEKEEEIAQPVPQAATARKKATAGAGMMQAEERNIGAISSGVYKAYISAGNGRYIVPLLLFSLVLMQGANVMSSYWLVYWQEMKWPRSQGFYASMGIYALLGVSQAISFFLMGSTFAGLTYFASQNLHKQALTRVMHAPMSFFETTPLGRIMHRFTKDCDTIDSTLGEALRMFSATLANIIGAIILIAIILPWFLIAVAAILIMYVYYAAFYRSSAREIKRLDAILRSALYTHFSESLSGLATIRAYGVSERFLADNQRLMDTENRAYWLTISNQRWLGVRLDVLGSLLTFVVSMLAVGERFSISPSQTGVVLAYILSVQQAFGWMVRQSAEVENDMNSVERVLHYASEVEQEAPIDIPETKPAAPWPSEGKIEMNKVVLKYRPGLPAVIKGISMTVQAGEKIGIVGRTGAGKSSIMTALFRLVELTSGSIQIDGVDVSKIGLGDLRTGLSIIPQDPLLFSGTLRSNLDPFNLHDDATLWDALRRSYLVEPVKPQGSIDEGPSGVNTPMNKFTLDSVIEDEGQNLSVGQRSLVSLARALVKDSRIIVLDEATSSVDYETDRNIQDTISHEFADRTILCIAHRLATIIAYDRICVMDAGQIAEFDTPARLFEIPGGIFRGMCDNSAITLDDIKLAAKTRAEMLKEMTE
ncbi:oligomycin resistance ATP-dependent permease YOR1 [Favolaschia claudopus]|uniref:Oligomycin resistance ATP-dependent permease YOR1 n=1 Tax=Favolaschia claudopus TaxID=2862362 RepID=A0AAW0C1H0_9AGAR